MVTYHLLSRKMGNEFRLTYRKALMIGVSISALFVYVLNMNTCDSTDTTSESLVNTSPIMYAVTPTYFRPVQKAELTR